MTLSKINQHFAKTTKRVPVCSNDFHMSKALCPQSRQTGEASGQGPAYHSWTPGWTL